MKILLTGIAGTGKSTIIERISTQGLAAYDMDAVEGLCRWLHKKTGQVSKHYSGVGKDWLEAHEWTCDETKLKNLIATDENIIIGGIPANIATLARLFDKVLLLHCSDEEIIHRLNTREGNDFGKTQAEKDLIMKWRSEFEAEMKRQGAKLIDNSQPLDKVVTEIFKELE